MRDSFQKRPRPVFIISTGRSGSQMLAYTLAKIPAVCALHEPLPHLNVEAFAHWSGLHDRQKIMSHVRHKRKGLVEQVQGNGLIYVESSHYCTHLVRYLSELFEARFIYVYRDGRSFVRSGLERGWYKRQSPITQLKAYLRRRFLIDIGNSYLDHRLQPPRHLRTPFEKTTWLWAEINSIALRELATIDEPDKYMLPLESFNQEKLLEICQFLGIQPHDALLTEMIQTAQKKPNQTTQHTVAPPKAWDLAEKQRFQELAGDVMARLGYQL